jgi:hypothetical protein
MNAENFPYAAGPSAPSDSVALSWHTHDPEQRIGFNGGRFTSPNKLLGLLIACLLTAVFFTIIIFGASAWQPTQHLARIFLERGPTQYVTTAFFFWALALLWLKSRKVGFQRKAFNLPIMPNDPSFCLSPETARSVLHRLHELVDNPMHFAVLNRIERALSNLDNMGNTADMTAILKIQSENDESQVASSYGLIHGLMWAIPVLGFIGTVLGSSHRCLRPNSCSRGQSGRHQGLAHAGHRRTLNRFRHNSGRSGDGSDSTASRFLPPRHRIGLAG